MFWVFFRQSHLFCFVFSLVFGFYWSIAALQSCVSSCCAAKWISHVRCSVTTDSLWPHGLQAARLLCLCHFPGKNTGLGCHFLLKGIFQIQRLNLGLPHCRQIFTVWATRNQPYGYAYLHYFGFSAHLGHHRALRVFPLLYSRLSLVIYFIYSRVYMSIPISQSHLAPHSPLWYPYVCFLYLYIWFANRFIRTIFSKFHTYGMWNAYSTHMHSDTIFAFLFLTSLCMTISRSIYGSANDTISFLLWLSNIPLYPANGGDMGLIPGLRKPSGEGQGNRVQYTCLGNPMDRATWLATVHGVAKSQIWLGD